MNSIYFFSGHNVPSGVSRRRAAQLTLMRQQEAICPDGLKACKVPGGSADAFEVSEARGSWRVVRGSWGFQRREIRPS